jgi:hypothetical protein
MEGLIAQRRRFADKVKGEVEPPDEPRPVFPITMVLRLALEHCARLT